MQVQVQELAPVLVLTLGLVLRVQVQVQVQELAPVLVLTLALVPLVLVRVRVLALVLLVMPVHIVLLALTMGYIPLQAEEGCGTML